MIQIKSVMAYDTILADRVRERLAHLPNLEEKKMMGGLTFMYNDKMCVGIFHDQLMCRIDPDLHQQVVEKPGCRTMDFSRHPMIGYVLVEQDVLKSHKEFNYWIDLCLDFNSKAKSSKKKK